MRGLRGYGAVSVVLACTALAACSSSGSHATPTPTTSAAPTSSAAPTTSSPPATSSAPSTSQAPTTSAKPVAKPLSAFEADPGIMAYRAWATEAAHTINHGHYTSAALEKLMTPHFATLVKSIIGTEVGRLYPGPIPYQPLRVVVVNSSSRTSYGCIYGRGFAVTKSHAPIRPVRILPVEIDATLSSGRWLMAELLPTTKVSCTHVSIATQKW